MFTLSLALHYQIDTYFDFEAPPDAPTIAPDGMIRGVKMFGLEQELTVRVFDNRSEAERTCGKDDVIQWEKITRRGSWDGERYNCIPDLRPSALSRRGF